MNILYLNNSVHLGGDTKCILKLCKELKDYNNIFIASNGGALESEFGKIGVEHFQIKNVTNKSPYIIISNVLKLRKIVKEKEIDVIHSHHRMATLTAKIVSKIINVKVIHTQHLCIEDKFRLTNVALKNIETIAVSKAAKRILVEKSNLDENRITTIYNTIETATLNKEIDPILLELKQKGYFLVAQVSRAVDYKGVYDFIEIAKNTVKKNPEIRFIFIGDGPELENMHKKIDASNLNNYVYLLGSKNNVIEQLKYIDLFLLCSYIEGLPLSPIEAFFNGIPVIATNIDGTNEEVIHGENGFLVEPKDVIGFVNYIELIKGNKSLYDKMSKNSIKRYEGCFTVDKYITKHLKVY